MNNVWTEMDKVYIKENPQMTDEELARYFQRVHQRIVTTSALKKFRQRMGAKKNRGRKAKKR